MIDVLHLGRIAQLDAEHITRLHHALLLSTKQRQHVTNGTGETLEDAHVLHVEASGPVEVIDVQGTNGLAAVRNGHGEQRLQLERAHGLGGLADAGIAEGVCCEPEVVGFLDATKHL